MSAPIVVSSSLLNSRLVKAARPDPQVVDAYMSGAIATKPAFREPREKRFSRRFGRKWQRSPDRAASLQRKRTLGGSSGLPDPIRGYYTEGERSALTVIAGEVKRHGVCDLPLDSIAAKAGVSRTTVQNALREARERGHACVQLRPCRGQKNLTNLITIVSKEWLAWIKRGPAPARSIGFKSLHPTKNTDKNLYSLGSLDDRETSGEAGKGLWKGSGPQRRRPGEGGLGR
jgi:hypothetical protein